MKGNQCHQCYKFCTYEEMDSFIPYGCADPEAPEPFDPTMLCKKCSEVLKQEFVGQFKKGQYRYGHWQKSRAEIEAAGESNLIWIGNNSSIIIDGKRPFNEYVSKTELEGF